MIFGETKLYEIFINKKRKPKSDRTTLTLKGTLFKRNPLHRLKPFAKTALPYSFKLGGLFLNWDILVEPCRGQAAAMNNSTPARAPTILYTTLITACYLRLTAGFFTGSAFCL